MTRHHHVIVFNVGDYWPANARQSVAAAAHRWAASLHELKAYPVVRRERGPFSAKFHLHEYATMHGAPGDRWLFLDGDMLVRSDCPSPFDLVPRQCFGAVRNFQGDTHRGDPDAHHRYAWEGVCAQTGVHEPYELGACHNGGLMLWTEGVHDAVFELMKPHYGAPGKPPPGIFEQLAFAVALKHLGVPMHWLPREFNRIGEAVWSPADLHAMPAYICHWANYFEFRRDGRKARVMDLMRWQGYPPAA